jgi:hypothetical protein
MNEIDKVVEYYFKLLNFCKSKDFDDKLFKFMTKNYTDMYKKIEFNSQGIIADKINNL